MGNLRPISPIRQGHELFAEPANRVYLSPVSAWEIVVKHAAGKLVLHKPPELLIPEQRALHQIRRLALHERDTLHLAQLPPLHKDSFDRMLVCQAAASNLVILTPDPLVRQYPVSTAW